LGKAIGGTVGRGEEAEIVFAIHEVAVRKEMVEASVGMDGIEGGIARGLVPTVC
jgi:hypothetical protein